MERQRRRAEKRERPRESPAGRIIRGPSSTSSSPSGKTISPTTPPLVPPPTGAPPGIPLSPSEQTLTGLPTENLPPLRPPPGGREDYRSGTPSQLPLQQGVTYHESGGVGRGKSSEILKMLCPLYPLQRLQIGLSHTLRQYPDPSPRRIQPPRSCEHIQDGRSRTLAGHRRLTN